MVRRAIMAHNCIILLNKTPKTSSCRMTRGNYSSALIPPCGGEGNTLKYRKNAITYKNESKQSGIIVFLADIIGGNCILWLNNMPRTISCGIKWGNYRSALIPLVAGGELL